MKNKMTDLIYEDLEFAVMSTDSDVDIVSLLVGVALALFFAPFSLGESITDDLEMDFTLSTGK